MSDSKGLSPAVAAVRKAARAAGVGEVAASPPVRLDDLRRTIDATTQRMAELRRRLAAG